MGIADREEALTISVTVDAICIGQPRPFNGAELSAIAKLPADGPVDIRTFGIVGDLVADTRVHGGPDMAVHHYPRDHYEWWEGRLGPHPLLRGPNAFGENIVASGLTEEGVHIGDRFRLGTAVLEVSQPRQPCWKIDHRFGTRGMVSAVVTSHRCGWYYRCIEEGTAKAGDTLERLEIGHEDWPVSRLFAKIFDKAHFATSDELLTIAALERLSEAFRNKILKSIS